MRIAEFKTFEKKDFSGETFRVLNQEEEECSEHHTKRLAWPIFT
jgi:hypothetical protein